MSDRPTIVLSALSATDGGPYTVCHDCISYAAENLSEEFRILVLTNNKELFRIPSIELIEISDVKKSWFHRLYYEYIYSPKLAKQLKPYLWFSLLDVTPKLESTIQAVYCHNPGPFYPLNWQYAFWEPKLFLFQTLYDKVYRKNIERNNFVVVQQEWLRREFEKRYPIRQSIVARPTFQLPNLNEKSSLSSHEGKFRFVYPVLARVGKNFEVICEAVERLEKKGLASKFEVLFFTDGKDTSYAQSIYKRYSSLQSLRFIGRKSREEVLKIYPTAQAMIFSSMHETWGMPLMEFKNLKRSILASRLPYAFETIGSYPKAKFFDPKDPEELAGYMREAIEGKLQFDPTTETKSGGECAKSWEELFELLLSLKSEASAQRKSLA